MTKGKKNFHRLRRELGFAHEKERNRRYDRTKIMIRKIIAS
jgi:hypothetical protein